MAEKEMNEIPRDLRALFAKGNYAALRENYDYAFELFTQAEGGRSQGCNDGMAE